MSKLNSRFLVTLLSGFSFKSFATPALPLSEGTISSPYEASQNVIIVPKNKYDENKSK